MRIRRSISPDLGLPTKFVVVSLVAWLCLVLNHPVAVAQQTGAARASLDQVNFDFGRVTQGTVVKHEFKIKNIGTAPLRIENIIPSCGCTATSATTNELQPGQEGAIAVEFDTDGFSGKKIKSVKVHVNDFEEPTILLSLSGYIEQDIQVTPARIFFGEVRKGEVKTEEITVSVRDGSTITIGDISSNSPNVSLSTVEKSPTRVRLKATLVSESKLGELRSRLLVKYKSEGERTINIPVFAMVKGLIELNPASVSLGVISGSEVMKRSVNVVNYSKSPVQIKEVQSSDNAVKASVKTIKPGSNFIIEISVNPKDVKKNLRALVTVVTDNQDQKELALNVYGAIPPAVH